VATAFGLAVAAGILVAAEGLARLLWSPPAGAETRYPAVYFFIDGHGITKPRPGGRYPASSVRVADGGAIYAVTYTIDASSRRVTPVSRAANRDTFLAFFGGSFTFGEGLEDDETIPFYAGELAPRCRPYNYGFHGHSAAEMLVRARTGTLRREIVEPTGAFVYTFVDQHVSRMIGSMRLTSSWAGHRPHFVLTEAGNLEQRGDFTTGRPWLSRTYDILGASRLLQWRQVDVPPWIGERHLDFSARLVAEARYELARQFPESRFVVVAYPGSRLSRRLAPLLAARGVDLLDYSDLFDVSDPRYFLAPEDRHPTALANRLLARLLVDDLGL